MTIRQFLKRRSDRYASCLTIFLLTVGVAASLIPRSFPLRFAFGAIVAVIIVAAFGSLLEIPCPVCQKSLRTLGLRVSLGGLRHSAPACPHCNTRIDAEMPAAAAPRPK